MKLISTFLIIITLISCSQNTNTKNLYIGEYPILKSEPETNSYFGKNIIDPYRNLENVEDTTNINWLKAQSDFANIILDRIDGRDSLQEQMKDLSTRTSYNVKKIRITKNENYFYLKRNKNEEYYKLYYKNSIDSKEEFVFDPRSYNIVTNKKYVINYIKPSWDAKYIAIAMSYEGNELSEMVILDMKTRTILPQVVTNCKPASYFGINWLPDNTGFTYLHFPETVSDKNSTKKDTKTVLYTLGEDPKSIKVVLSLLDSQNSKGHPVTIIKSQKSKYIIGYFSGVDNYWDAFYTEIENLKQSNPIWKPLYSKKDKVYRTAGIFHNNSFIYKSAKNSSNYAIASVDIETLDFNKPKILIEPKKDEILGSFYKTKKDLFYTTLKNGVEAKLYKNKNEIELPKTSGTLYLESIANDSNFWIYASGWTNNEERYKYNIKENTFINESLTTVSNYPEFENIIAKEVLVPSHDGELVPLSIVYNSDIKMDGKNQVLIDGYGAYGDNMNPYFSPILLSWVLQGGVLCTAHVRGGGEKGDAWHKGGFKTTKPNTWKDLIACGEYLIEQNYTSKKNMAIIGGSAGGLMVGNAIVERPDLFAASIVQVGQLNPLRHEARKGGGGTNYKEYGTIKDSIECMGLIAMDPYLKIKKDVDYPATLLTAGINDTRIPAWMPGKFAVRLQNSETKNPILFDVKYDSGHVIVDDNNTIYKEWSNLFSFALWQTGHPEYQLKNSN